MSSGKLGANGIGAGCLAGGRGHNNNRQINVPSRTHHDNSSRKPTLPPLLYLPLPDSQSATVFASNSAKRSQQSLAPVRTCGIAGQRPKTPASCRSPKNKLLLEQASGRVLYRPAPLEGPTPPNGLRGHGNRLQRQPDGRAAALRASAQRSTGPATAPHQGAVCHRAPRAARWSSAVG